MTYKDIIIVITLFLFVGGANYLFYRSLFTLFGVY